MEKERNNGQGKSKCTNCNRWYSFRKFMEHNCNSESQQTSNNYSHKKEDLQCSYCGLQMENPKPLEIHMISCMHRNIPQICKLCRNPIRLRSHDKQYCANCSTIKEGNPEYGLRFKATTLNGGLSSKSSRPYSVPTRNIENGNFPTVNCTDAESSLISARQRMAPMSVLKKQRKRKLKVQFAEPQVKKKQTQIVNPKIASAKEANTEKQIQVGMNQSRELHHTTDKLSKISRKNAMQQKKYFKGTNAEVASEKFLNNNLQKPNVKTSRQMDQKMKQTTKKNDHLPAKNNSTNKKVTVQLLLDTIPENDCGMLLQSSSANKIDPYYKCCRCGKAFRSIKLGSTHLSNCKSNKLLSTEVSTSDVKWVCTICHSFFSSNIPLSNHLKGCNIFTKKYDRACEERCEKCHFRCLSSLSFEKHDCTKELESMKTCAVRLNVVKMNSTAGRVVMHECEFCSEIFDEILTEQHFQSHHPGEPSSGNFKQYYVNLNPGSYSDTVVVKTEPVSPVHKCVEEAVHYPLDNHYYPPYDPVPDSISMPPPPVPIVHSTVGLPTHHSPLTLGEPSTSHSASDGARVNEHCKCVNRSMENDAKPCLTCLRKFDITKVARPFKVVPFGLAKIKKETSQDLEVSNSNTQADGSIAASLTQSGGEMVNVDSDKNGLPFTFFDTLPHNPALTPPSSHNGISPPATPLVQSLTNEEPRSPSNVSIGSLNDAISMVPDLSQLDEPRCPDQLVHYINDDSSPDIPLEQCDDQELFTPIDSHGLTHLWDVDCLDDVDAWAIVPSEDDETVEKYICSECISVSCLDKNSIIKHLCENHEKKLQYLVMYIVKSEYDSE